MTSLGADAPPLLAFFDGEDLERKQHVASYLLTTTDDGWPHAAMISAGELMLGADGTARLALWQRSRTRMQLSREGRATLLVVLGGAAYRVRLSLREAATQPVEGLQAFTGTIASVDVDSVAYASLDSGVTYRLRDAADTLARWRHTVAALRTLEG